MRQRGDVMSGGSYDSSSDQRLHFGLGQTTTVGAVEIHWPSGLHENVTLPSVDRYFVVEEGKGVIPSVYDSRSRLPEPTLGGSMSTKGPIRHLASSFATMVFLAVLTAGVLFAPRAHVQAQAAQSAEYKTRQMQERLTRRSQTRRETAANITPRSARVITTHSAKTISPLREMLR